MKYLPLLLTASVMLAAMSCNQLSNKQNADEAGAQVQAIQVNEPPDQKNEQIPAKNENKDWDKKIIKTLLLNVEVTDFHQYNKQLNGIVKTIEGYIANEEENSSDETLRNTLILKVPTARFDDAINLIESLGGRMVTKKISSDDVTAEVFDTRARIEAKKRIRLRYLDMLAKAKNMEEILQVEKEVNQVQEQIEAAEGRLNYLVHSSSYSTIELTFFQILNGGMEHKEPGYGDRFIMALNDGLKWTANLIIFFAALWPLWMGLTIFFILLKRLRFSRVNTPKQ
ncbi:MAG: DUF4349 domain-containing protein [Chitinophagaceae bacterium]|nr:DUF4349 domain-containing protein [Chitinophagaceae bacterium]